ncbi:hypothetical protein Tco_1108194 [Tanacetum coccineum]
MINVIIDHHNITTAPPRSIHHLTTKRHLPRPPPPPPQPHHLHRSPATPTVAPHRVRWFSSEPKRVHWVCLRTKLGAISVDGLSVAGLEQRGSAARLAGEGDIGVEDRGWIARRGQLGAIIDLIGCVGAHFSLSYLLSLNICPVRYVSQYTASLFRSERPCLLSMERTIAVTLCHRSDRIFQNEIHLQTGGETPATCVEWVIAQHEDYSRKLTLYTGPHVLRLSIPHHMEGDLVSCGIMGWVGKQLLMNYSSRRLSHPDHPERSTTHRNARMTRISSSMCIHKVYHSDVLAESQDNRRMTLVNTCEQEYMAHASFSDRDRDRVCDSRDISLSLNTLYPTFYFNLPTLFNALPYVCCMYTNTLCIDCSYGGVRYKFLFLPGISFTLFSTPEHRAASEYGASEVVVVCWLGGDGGVRW